MMESSTKVVLDLLTRTFDRLVLAEESECLRNLVRTIVGLTRHGAEEVGDAEGEIDHGLFGGQVVGAEEIDYNGHGMKLVELGDKVKKKSHALIAEA